MDCKNVRAARRPDEAGLAELAEDARVERERLGRQEGEAVLTLLRLAVHLAKMRALAKGGWAAQAGSMGLKAPTACALVRVGGSGLPAAAEADEGLRLLLPVESANLAWLSRLPIDALRGLLGQLDVKQAPASDVIRAVKEALGTPPQRGRPSGAAAPEGVVKAAFRRMAALVLRVLDRHADDEAARARARDAVDDGLRDLSQLLADTAGRRA